ncbi:sure-like protein [Testicularia cyperi]|uniref:Sure-like protein n=1 Tax=Testicularia cyperi TaxID=1882483 RepID=A0A317Y1D6_9BASI|nr:sure-like protein [Testicularia cyperi]
MPRLATLHASFTALLVVLVSILLYRDHYTRYSNTSSFNGIDLSGQLSDTFQDDYDSPSNTAPRMSSTMSDTAPSKVDASSRPKVLLVNDDGPPSKYSPHVLGLYQELTAIGWDVTVVLPSFQKSWGSMQFSLQGPVSYWYYYPIQGNSDGSHPETQQSWSATRRPINKQRGEVAEWVLIDGSPTTASNSGLFNQNAFFGDSDESRAAPPSTTTPFDLVLSGPNFGRNTGTAFALSSGTLGAALAASLAGVRSIALSYGHFMLNPPTLADRAQARGPGLEPEHLKQVAATANKLATQVVQKLWSNWSNEPDVGCYSVNIPLAETIIRQPEFIWTRIWENRYGPLFAADSTSNYSSPPAPQPPSAPEPRHSLHFAPNMASLLRPKSLPRGTDVWAIQNGYISITRLRPNFMEVDNDGNGLDVSRIERQLQQQQQQQQQQQTNDDAQSANASIEDGIEVGKRWRL